MPASPLPQRMADGTYGLCLHCGEPIPVERLRQIPRARYGARVQERIERGEIQAATASRA